MTNATYTFKSETLTNKCTNCTELDQMNDGSWASETCSHTAGQTTTDLVHVTITVDDLNYGTKTFYSYHGKNPQADAEAYVADLKRWHKETTMTDQTRYLIVRDARGRVMFAGQGIAEYPPDENVEVPVYLTAYRNHWGRGPTPEDSKKQARKHGGRGAEWITYQLPDGAIDPYVSGMGSVKWTWAEGYEPEDGRPTPLQIIKKGRDYKND